MMPYGWCVLALLLRSRGRSATVGAVIALAWDLAAHYSVFTRPGGSTAAPALVFTPLWNAAVFVPASMAVTSAALRRRQEDSGVTPAAVDVRQPEDESTTMRIMAPPSPRERSPEYAARLRALAERVGRPREYTTSLSA
jgi:hypothetical protein